MSANRPIKITMAESAAAQHLLDEAIVTASAKLAAAGYAEEVIDQEMAFALAHRAMGKGIDIAGEELREAREIQVILGCMSKEVRHGALEVLRHLAGGGAVQTIAPEPSHPPVRPRNGRHNGHAAR